MNTIYRILFVPVTLAALTAVLPAAAQKDKPAALQTKIYLSPDHKLVAKVMDVKQWHPYGGNPSRIEIHDRTGRLLASRDHSWYPNQGLGVCDAGWTKDSRFFVYVTTESGGHGPWRHPTFFFSRKNRAFYNVEDVLDALGKWPGCVITGWLKLRGASTLVTEGRFNGKEGRGIHVKPKRDDDYGEAGLTIDLLRVERRLTRALSSTDQRDKKARAAYSTQ